MLFSHVRQPTNAAFVLNLTLFFFFFYHLALSVSTAVSKMVRAALVTVTSLALTGAVVAHAYLLKHQFYPTVVYLTKSSPSMAVRRIYKILVVDYQSL